MSKELIILSVSYVVGYLFSFSMLKIEHEAESKTYTKLDRLLIIAFSFLSFILVIGLLVSAWFKKIANTGYWNEPVKKQSK